MKLLIRSRKPTFIFALMFLGFSFFMPNLSALSHAQTTGVRVTLTPQYPGPFQNVNIMVENFSQDINKVDISWSVNGKVIKKGTGLTQFQLTTGALGSVSNLSINMGGDVQTLAIRPNVTDLLWQADTYTPPFYEGKALHTSQDPITVVAEPFILNSSGVRLDPAKLIYKWKQDNSVVNTASGYGKTVFQIATSILPKPIDVSVEVSSTDGTYHSEAFVTIPNSQPEILLYENHPLYGIRFENALNDQNFALSSAELKIHAVPFFFSNRQKDLDLLAYDWSLNNSPINQQGNEVIFRKPDGTTSGQSSVSVATRNLERFLQTGSASLNINFNQANQPASQSIF